MKRKATPSTLPFTTSSLQASIVGEIELRRRHVDAVAGEAVAGLVEQLGGVSSALEGMQPTLRQVPPWVGALLDAGDLQAELGRADGADVAAGAGADDDEIVGLPCAGSLHSVAAALALTARQRAMPLVANNRRISFHIGGSSSGMTKMRCSE